MYIQLVRLKDNGESTIGTLSVNGEFECFTIEDTFREIKIPGETRIPPGTYDIKLRTEGGLDKKYESRYGSSFHSGMLWLQDVPGFEWVYIHVGNRSTDSSGCILIGTGCNSGETEQMVLHSVAAYKKLYPKIVAELEAGEQVTIEII